MKNKNKFEETLIEAKYGPAIIKIGVSAQSLKADARKTLATMVWRALEESRVLEFQWSRIRHSDYWSGIHHFYEQVERVKTRQAIRVSSKNVHAGVKLRIRRKQLNLTQDQLAKAAQVDRTHLSHIEHGKVVPKEETWQRLQQVLNPKRELPICGCRCHIHATNR